MAEYAYYICHGLAINWPSDQLAAWLHSQGYSFTIVGAADPQPLEGAIRASIERDLEANKKLVFIGHSKGAMLGYYLKYPAPLIVTIDPPDWASNIECPDWILTPPFPGQWRATDGVGRWINIHQPGYPGGGVLSNPGPNREDHFVPDADHMSVVNHPLTRNIIIDALKKLK